MLNRQLQQLKDFFEQRDENGVSNMEKGRSLSHVIRRVAATDKSKSFEDSDLRGDDADIPGAVIVDGRLIGFGIHIMNEDVYPLQSFEIYLRGCELTGRLNLCGCTDLTFLDLYNNRLNAVELGSLPAMRILGLQNNRIEMLDVSALPVCQGMDLGKNRLSTLDLSNNPELVELYINDNEFESIDLRANQKLKYFYCHNNRIQSLDCRQNPLLRHLDCTGNPMHEILCRAPQRDEALPLELYAQNGGYVGLRFKPIYNAQWKETGEWEQSYHATPMEGCKFLGWFDKDGKLLSEDPVWTDDYGASRQLTASFER